MFLGSWRNLPWVTGPPRQAALALLITSSAVLTPLRSEALIIVQVRQDATGVTVQASGKYITDALSKVTTFPIPDDNSNPPLYPSNPFTSNPSIASGFGFFQAGEGDSGEQKRAFLWRITNPTLPADNFGTEFVTESAFEGGGLPIGIDAGFPGEIYVILPTGDEVANLTQAFDIGLSTALFAGSSFSSLGLTPGTYSWAWGSGEDQRLTLQIEDVPAPLPLLGASAAFGWSRRLKRRVRAAQALADRAQHYRG